MNRSHGTRKKSVNRGRKFQQDCSETDTKVKDNVSHLVHESCDGHLPRLGSHDNGKTRHLLSARPGSGIYTRDKNDNSNVNHLPALRHLVDNPLKTSEHNVAADSRLPRFFNHIVPAGLRHDDWIGTFLPRLKHDSTTDKYVTSGKCENAIDQHIPRLRYDDHSITQRYRNAIDMANSRSDQTTDTHIQQLRRGNDIDNLSTTSTRSKGNSIVTVQPEQMCSFGNETFLPSLKHINVMTTATLKEQRDNSSTTPKHDSTKTSSDETIDNDIQQFRHSNIMTTTKSKEECDTVHHTTCTNTDDNDMISLNQSPTVVQHCLDMGYEDHIPVYPKFRNTEDILDDTHSMNKKELMEDTDSLTKKGPFEDTDSNANNSLSFSRRSVAVSRWHRLNSQRSVSVLLTGEPGSKKTVTILQPNSASMSLTDNSTARHHHLDDNFNPRKSINMSRKEFFVLKMSGPEEGPRKLRDSSSSSSGLSVVPMAKVGLTSRALGKLKKSDGVQASTSARRIAESIDVFIKRLMKRFDIKDAELVRNILAYTRSLSVPRSSVIDKNTFVAQLEHTFGISDAFLIDRIWDSNTAKYANVMDIEEFAKMVCAFVAPDFIYQCMFAFNVYDLDKNDTLDMPEYKTLLRPCVANVEDDLQDDDSVNCEKALEELILLVLNLFRKTRPDPEIHRFEWFDTVRRQPILVQCLGACLPVESKLNAFMKLMTSKNHHEIALHYRYERRRCLRDPHRLPTDAQEDLYPIMLEFD